MAAESVETLQSYVNSLNKAIASGARSVTLGSQTITYNTSDSLIRARNDMEMRLMDAKAKATGKRRTGLTQVVQDGRGY